jgi:hypothetical protein
VTNPNHPSAALHGKGKAQIGRRARSELAAEARLAAEILRSRRQRERAFGANLFADPAWDMLLELFVQEESGNVVHVSSLCMASAVPTTTALRWIGTLTEAKLLERRPTGSNRKVEICLSRRARFLVRRHLRETLDAVARVACPSETDIV